MLFRKYAPKSWEEVVGQDKAIATLLRIRSTTGLSSRAYWITVSSGTGKTTIANLIASDFCDDFCIEETDATGLTPTDITRLEKQSQVYGMGKTGRAVIINEAHGLRRDTVRQLLVTLERIPKHVAWIFTTTTEGNATLFEGCDDASPLVSRCLQLELSRQGLNKPFAERARTIAIAEGLSDAPIAKFERLAKDCRNNMRMILSQIESGNIAA